MEASPYFLLALFFAGKVIYVLSFFTFFMGILLFFKPAMVGKWNKDLYKPYSFRKVTKPLEILRTINSSSSTVRRVGGLFFMIGAGYIAVYFGLFFDIAKFTTALGGNRITGFFVEIIFESARIFFVLSGIFAFIICFIFTFFPKPYEKISSSLERWISTRKMIMPLEEEVAAEGRIFFKHHRIFGAIATFGSLYVMWNLHRLRIEDLLYFGPS